jgi:hypothetical protein
MQKSKKNSKICSFLYRSSREIKKKETKKHPRVLWRPHVQKTTALTWNFCISSYMCYKLKANTIKGLPLGHTDPHKCPCIQKAEVRL